MHCIYLISNETTNLHYVGQTKNYTSRRAGHLRELREGKHFNSRLQRSWNKYGEGSFTIEKIECVDTQQDADNAERFYISYFRFLGLALCNNREGGKQGYTFSPEAIQKMRLGRLGKTMSMESRLKISASLKTRLSQSPRSHTDATKAKLSQIKKNTPLSLGFIASWHCPKGPCSEETKRKIAEKARIRGSQNRGASKICQFCGKSYVPPIHHWHRSKTCSQDCSSALSCQTKRKNIEIVTRVCPVCETIFEPNTNHKSRQKTCGKKECVNALRVQAVKPHWFKTKD